MEVFNWKELLYPYEQTVEELIVKFKLIALGFSRMGVYSPINSVEGRVKSISSILDKANRKNISFDNIERSIEDIAGVRILCQFVEDIARVVVLIRDRSGLDLEVLEERDYVTQTKKSGYRSYHVIVKYSVGTSLGIKDVIAEIQIRTLAMNFWATIEHSLKYKYSGNIPPHLMNQLVECAEASFALDNKMSTIRDEIMEAQKINLLKSELVNEILDKIQRLYFNAKFNEIDNINRKFFDLYDKGDLEELVIFNQQLDVLSDLYKV